MTGALADDVLVERVRSRLGPVLRHLDSPRLHVMSRDGVVVLHGDVPDATAAAAIEDMVATMPGARGVQSHLHVGLLPGDSRPSDGTRAHRSALLEELLAAAVGHGFLNRTEAQFALRGLLGVFTARLPEPAREHLGAHLPPDVRRWARPPRWLGTDIATVRKEHDFAALVAVAGGMDREQADELAARALPVLRRHLGGEAAHVAAVLPPDLRRLWSAEPQ